ncbi:MAG TPA: hypothetical protein VJN71_01380 [Nitrososphaerales archaeon]|nr:hypothetical protein [Nitrososphaerales archaeon]
MIFTDTFLIIAGSAAAAVCITIAAYLAFSDRKEKSTMIATSIESQTTPSIQSQQPEVNSEIPSVHVEQPVSISETESSHQITAIPVASAPVPEAPAPFSEELISPPGTTTPTDVTALSNIASPTDGTTSGVLVIPTPKRRARTKRLPADGSIVTTRKRSSRKKPVITETAAFPETQPVMPDMVPGVITGQQNETNPS